MLYIYLLFFQALPYSFATSKFVNPFGISRFRTLLFVTGVYPRRSSLFCTLLSLFASRVFRNSFAIKRIRTPFQNCRGVTQQFPFWNLPLIILKVRRYLFSHTCKCPGVWGPIFSTFQRPYLPMFNDPSLVAHFPNAVQ
jgi:hypothetical protein